VRRLITSFGPRVCPSFRPHLTCRVSMCELNVGSYRSGTNLTSHVTFQGLTAASMKIRSSYYIAQCSAVEVDRSV
jgi:hypothetical protein